MNIKIKNFLHSFWGGAIIVIFVIILGYFIWGILTSGGIIFSLSGPDNIKSGEIGEFHLKYVNNSRMKIEDCSIEINLPEGIILREDPLKKTIVFEIGEVLSKVSGDKIVDLMITGEPKTAKNIEAVFNYRPKGLSSSFSKKDIKAILLSGSSFNLEINVPKQIFIDQIFPFEINWANLTQQTFENIELRAEWPTGFSFETSNPDVTKEEGSNNKWVMGVVGASGQGKINVGGAISGLDGETKRIVLTLGLVQNKNFLPLIKTEGFLNLISNPLKISAFVNGDINYNADLGENLDFTINYENNYSSSLRDLKITTQLNGDVFDFSTLKAPKGLFSTRLQTITWTGVSVKELYVLNPGEKGTLNFSVKLKKDWPMQSLAQKNIILEAKITIESASVPQELGYQGLPRAQALDTIKLNSNCALNIESYFWDAPSQIVNTGKIPLKAGEPTDFTIHWKILNTYNTINNVTVQATLPLWIEWTSQIAGNYGDYPPVYDPNNRQITWTVAIVPVGSGTVLKPYEAIFQVKATPLSSQVNQGIDLTNETTLTATDTFTLKNISFSYPVVNSNKLTDPAIPYNGGIVRP
ncbi:MAG: hypothetical protein WC306_02535 [Candidatus Paceibacterota bacterium]|jgi:hypothetical protein